MDIGRFYMLSDKSHVLYIINPNYYCTKIGHKTIAINGIWFILDNAADCIELVYVRL